MRSHDLIRLLDEPVGSRLGRLENMFLGSLLAEHSAQLAGT